MLEGVLVEQRLRVARAQHLQHRAAQRRRSPRRGRPPSAVAASVIALSSSRESSSSAACAESVIALGPARAGDRDHGRAEREQPGQRDLLRRDAVRLGGLGTGSTSAVPRGVADAAERRPGQERDPALAAEVDLALDRAAT